LAIAVATLFLGACEYEYPQVAVVNQTDEHILIRNISFSGCLWATVLAFDGATSPDRCLPGEDRVRVQKFDAAAYCNQQALDGTIAGICPCDGGSVPEAGVDPGLANAEPLWFNYQTKSVKHVGYGEFHVFRVTLDDLEQDFSVPGPYGH
jgi:hypothetical protein